jgi:D-alanine--poly(phosphoribitol) ligase subunit 1
LRFPLPFPTHLVRLPVCGRNLHWYAFLSSFIEPRRTIVHHNLAHPFFESALAHPESLALSVGDNHFTYSELRELAQPIARWIRTHCHSRAPRVGILASRTPETYLGILGACWAGGTYIPLSPKYPEERLLQHFERIALDALIVDSNGMPLLTERVLSRGPRNILVPGMPTSSERPLADGTKITLSGRDAIPAFDPSDKPVEVSPDHTAYIIFTSGTTGIPKGVMIPASAVNHFVEAMQSQYSIQRADRVAGVTEITFDLSVFDLFVTWKYGAALLVVPATQMMAPSSFIQRHLPTIVFTVPSIAASMQRMKLLAPNSMTSLRYSFFAGEPLPVASASMWKAAAPNSVVDNLFGPTEATVVCIGQRFHGPENATPTRGVVAIGTPFPRMEAAIVDASLQFVADGQNGELLLSGPQLSSGYFGDSELSGKCFPDLAGRRWYRTGDLAYRDTSGVFHHLGRIDNQVKVFGLRVELEEIEAHLREVYETDSVAVIAWPVEHGSASGIVAFVSGQYGADDSAMKAQIKKRLPSYMVPSVVHHIESIPLNANGKVNRKELGELAAQGKRNEAK